MPVYDHEGTPVRRRQVVVDRNQPPCGVLVNLENIQGLFNPDAQAAINLSDDMSDASDWPTAHLVNVDAYPLGFLRTAGNIQADGVPHCFYPVLTTINGKVRKNHRSQATNHASSRSTPTYRGESDDSDSDSSSDSDRNLYSDFLRRKFQGVEDEPDEDDDARAFIDVDEEDTMPSVLQVVKPIGAQLYNHITHRVASRAGKHDSQQGTVTAAISGAFANTQKDRATASEKQSYCEIGLPSDRFHKRISGLKRECPTACRAELIYSIDVRALKDPSGS